MPLTPKQERFVREYLIDLNATQAAVRAGYSRKTAHSIGHENLRKPDIQRAIAQSQKTLATKLEVTAARIVAELAKIGFANMQDYMRVGADGDPCLDFSKVTRDQAAALCEVTVEDFKDGRGEDARDVRRVKFKLADKRAALVDLGRHLGLFKEKIERSGKLDIGSEDALTVLESRLAGIASRVGAGPDHHPQPNRSTTH
jgi:phage terminase small subunit